MPRRLSDFILRLGLAAHNFPLARPSGYSTLWLRPAGAHRRLRNLAKKLRILILIMLVILIMLIIIIMHLNIIIIIIMQELLLSCYVITTIK